MVKTGKDSIFSLRGHRKNRGSNLMGNKCNIRTFLPIKYKKKNSVPLPMMINEKNV
jgi:hypothetical protein